ncbi:predicted protein, partial [Nematostella vectensis]
QYVIDHPSYEANQIKRNKELSDMLGQSEGQEMLLYEVEDEEKRAPHRYYSSDRPQGIGLVWESYKLDPYVQKLAEAVFNFQEKVDDLLSSVEKIDIEVRSLDTCSYNNQTFRDVLGKIQKAVDELNLHSYSNLPSWVNTLDQQ